jgi:hypothetical protein
MRILLAIALAAIASPSNDVFQLNLRDHAALAGQHAASRIAPEAITQERAAFWLIIPAAGSTPGVAGTLFRSDLMISNHRGTAQLVDLSWCQQGTPCSVSGYQLMRITVPGSSVVFYSDIVRQLGKSGLGTLDIRARLSDGTLDTSAKIDAFSRIWTPMAYSSGTSFDGGTTSQSFPAVKIDNVHGSARAYILGLQQDIKYRTNIGIYNDDPNNAHTFTVRAISADNQTFSFTITVQPWSMNQMAVPFGTWGNFMAIVSPDAGIGTENWAAYGSSTDNITGDGWVSIGSQND